MKQFIFLLIFASDLACANPCHRLLAEARALDLNSAVTEYDLETWGHLKISTPLQVNLPELKDIFARKPIFTSAGYERQRTLTFRREWNWALDPEQAAGRDESELVIPELKQFGLLVGQKLETVLRSKLPNEHLRLTTLMLRWTSADITTIFPEDERPELAHLDLNAVYLNSVLTLLGDGTIYWNSNAIANMDHDFSWSELVHHYPPAGQTRPGEVLVLTGVKRSMALNRPELATLHSAPDVDRHANRLAFLFYFDRLE